MPFDNISKLKGYDEIIAERIADFEGKSISLIAKELGKIGRMSKASAKKYDAKKKADERWKAIVALLIAVDSMNAADIKRAYDDEFSKIEEDNALIYEYRGVGSDDFADDIAEEYSRSAVADMMNFTDTSALRVIDGDGEIVRLKDEIYRAFSEAVKSVRSGGEDFHAAMRKTVQSLGGNGVRVDYGSGVTRKLDTVVRQNLLYGLKKMNIEYSEKISKELNCDGYEIDAHANSRPSHEFMQGKQYCIGRGRTINGVRFVGFEETDPESPDGLSASRALEDYGCRHYRTPIICGISVPRFSNDQLQKIKDENARIYEIDGKKGNRYFWTQKMRALETEIRKCRGEINALKSFGNSEPQISELRQRIRAFQAKYDQIAEVTRIDKETNRMTVQKQTENFTEIFRKQFGTSSNRIAISQRRFDELTAQVKKNGANIIRCNYGDEIYKHLEKNNATASCIGKTILFRPDATVSEVLEETRHFMQNIENLNNDKPLELRLILNEIEAGEFILENAAKYGVPRAEIEEIKRNVNVYKERLKLLGGETKWQR